MLNPKAWYIIVKIFGVLYTSFGPYETKDDCIKQMIVYGDEARSRYAQGERMQVYGVTVHPKNVNASCQLK